jgi:predicted amidohydrolase
MYDLVLKGGTVVDPSTGLDGPRDVAVENGLIARIAPDRPWGWEPDRALAAGPGGGCC